MQLFSSTLLLLSTTAAVFLVAAAPLHFAATSDLPAVVLAPRAINCLTATPNHQRRNTIAIAIDGSNPDDYPPPQSSTPQTTPSPRKGDSHPPSLESQITHEPSVAVADDYPPPESSTPQTTPAPKRPPRRSLERTKRTVLAGQARKIGSAGPLLSRGTSGTSDSPGQRRMDTPDFELPSVLARSFNADGISAVNGLDPDHGEPIRCRYRLHCPPVKRSADGV